MDKFAQLEKIPDAKDETAVPLPELLNLYSIPVPPADDRSELLKHRFLCRGSTLLVVGNTGIGKSTFVMQCAIQWSVGRDAFGIKPNGPLRVLIVPAENDPGDMAEIRDGILAAIKLTPEEQERSVIVTAFVDSFTGFSFCANVLKPFLEKEKPDIVIIDPALAYLGGDASQQRDVSEFLRGWLSPLLHEFQCGLVLVHHNPKPPRGEQKGSWTAGEFAYSGTGSAEWANWARAVIVIHSRASDDYFELRAAKRGKRLHWTDENTQEPVCIKIIAHSTTGICWLEATKEQAEAARRDEDNPPVRVRADRPKLNEFVAIFPTELKGDPREGLLSAKQIKGIFTERGWCKNSYCALCKEAESVGHIIAIPGKGRGGEVLRGLARMVAAYEKLRLGQSIMKMS